ncbi:hypothetical protein SO802_016347 [Lithocarpus litseifolius]|uniref:Uncharacterized protein n=1 Tax=Lithocarpus litseifolius TaxID=425828 RepID=A0AAW2CZZ2_9ROSI
MADTDSGRDSVMADPDSDEYDSEVELEIATAYVQLCIECDLVMADIDSDRDSVMADPDSDEYDSEVELEIATAYI